MGQSATATMKHVTVTECCRWQLKALVNAGYASANFFMKNEKRRLTNELPVKLA
jgi:hypothetical protein